MEQFRNQGITTGAAGAELGLSPRRFRQLYRDYLAAAARKEDAQWCPGRSGGNRRRSIREEVEGLWKRLLSVRPSASYRFAASEVLRGYGFAVDRATVRHWAHERQLMPCRAKADPAPVRRWQCGKIGTLWQLDVSPHPWFGPERRRYPLFDMLDDCSRLVVGARLYKRENLPAYLEFLARAFEQYGLPLALYVDYHSFFFSQVPDALTYLGEALHFYGISFRYAPTPQAKGNVERLHQFWQNRWQNRLPTLFAAEAVADPATANPWIDKLREHHNRMEIHRELARTLQAAWDAARREKRSELRPHPRFPWWRYVWSLRTEIKMAADGTVPAGTQRDRIESCPPKTVLVRCEHGTVPTAFC